VVRAGIGVRVRLRVTFMSIENSKVVMKPEPSASIAFHTASTCRVRVRV
jgi:hypothetical protein